MQEKTTEEKEKKINVGREIMEWIACFIIAYVIYLVISNFLGTIAGVRQSSMTPNAKEGDKVVISKIGINNRTYKRGEIVIVEAPIQMASESQNNIASYETKTGLDYFVYSVMGIGKKSYIKRVIGLPGEHIYISEEGDVYINNVLIEEEYLNGIKTPRTGAYYNLVVPDKCVFVMGDNRAGSSDSRIFGAIPYSKVEGLVVLRIWPLNKIGEI